MEKIKLDTNQDAILIGHADSITALQLLTLPTGTGAGGAIRKEDWEATTNAHLIDVPGTAVHSVDQIKIQDIDLDGREDLAIVIDSDSFITFSTSGTTLTIEWSMSALDVASSIEFADIDGDGSPDMVLGGGEDIRIAWGPDPPAAKADPILDLANWQPNAQRLPHDLSGVVPSGYSIEEILVHDWNNDGYADILVVASNTAGDTIRKVIEVTKTEADARDLTGATETDIQLSDESGLEILDIKKLDVNNDGAEDVILTYEDGTSAVILSKIEARTDLSSLSDSTTGVIEELKDDLNPSVIQIEGGSASTDGAWKRIETDVGGDVTQWGYGQIVDCTTKICAGRDNVLDSSHPNYVDPSNSITVGSAVDPTDPSVSDHGPPCALPGSDVVPVTSELLSFDPTTPLKTLTHVQG